jgi:hypothetical protein
MLPAADADGTQRLELNATGPSVQKAVGLLAFHMATAIILGSVTAQILGDDHNITTTVTLSEIQRV